MITGRHFAILMLMILCLQCVEENSVAVPPMSLTQKQEALFLETLSMPCPGEVFAALNKVSHPNWKGLVTPVMTPSTSDRTQLALVVGVLAANGYIAVQAQDGQQVKNVGREMMTAAKALGISQNLMGRGNSLIEFAQNNAWDSLSDELEATENELKSSMREQKDDDLILLTSVAAWIRGLDVGTQVVLGSDHQADGTAVIRQPELARHLAARIESLPERIKRAGLVSEARQGLAEIARLMDGIGISTESDQQILQQIHETTSLLVKKIFISSESAQANARGGTP